MEEVAHHEDGQDETGYEQRDSEDETDGRALTQRQTNNEACNEENQADSNAK
jgi:hypothetical protein